MNDLCIILRFDDYGMFSGHPMRRVKCEISPFITIYAPLCSWRISASALSLGPSGFPADNEEHLRLIKSEGVINIILYFSDPNGTVRYF